MRTLFKNARLIGRDGESESRFLTVENGKIISFREENADETVDLKGKWVVPGFVDIHVHGGGGFDLCDATPEAVIGMCATHAQHGTTTIFPTLVSCSREMIRAVCDVFRKTKAQLPCHAVGLHLEGPFLSPAMCGAQRPDLIVLPTEEDAELVEENRDVISRITCAPEVEYVMPFAERLMSSGVSFSMGHTNATYEQAEAAYEAGFSSITHLYSATSGFHKVDGRVHIGVTQYAYAEKGIFAELIGDGCHVPKELMRLVVSVKGADRVCLVTDAMRAAGTTVTESYLGAVEPKNRVIVEDGVAKLPDRSCFAGSIGTMDRAFRFAVQRAGLSMSAAARLTSLTPATLMGLGDQKGSIEVGKDADLAVLDSELNVCDVYISGKKL